MYINKNNIVFNIFKQKKYWIIVLVISLLFTFPVAIDKLNNGEQFLFYALKSIASFIFGQFIITLIYCLIVYLIRDFKDSSIKGKLLTIGLLLLFSIKAFMEIMRSK